MDRRVRRAEFAPKWVASGLIDREIDFSEVPLLDRMDRGIGLWNYGFMKVMWWKSRLCAGGDKTLRWNMSRIHSYQRFRSSTAFCRVEPHRNSKTAADRADAGIEYEAFTPDALYQHQINRPEVLTQTFTVRR